MKTKTYGLDELKAMTPEQRNEVFMNMIKISGVAVVRDNDGNIKYDDPAKAGTYGEVEDGTNA